MRNVREMIFAFALLFALAFTITGTQAQDVSPTQARAIAKDAFVYGFPLVESYKTLYKQAVDRGNSDYRAPFNEIASAANVATPADTFVSHRIRTRPTRFVDGFAGRAAGRHHAENRKRSLLLGPTD